MRSTPEPTDRPIPPLGAPIRSPAPAPKAQKTDNPLIIKNPDGKLETNIPERNPYI